MRSLLIRSPFLLALALPACASSHAHKPLTDVQIPVLGAEAILQTAAFEAGPEAPPPSSPSLPLPFPTIHREELDSGLELAVIEARALPLVQLRLVVHAGSAHDGDLTGLARLTALMLKDGGSGRMSSSELLSKVEALGANLNVRAEADATTFSLAVPSRHLDEALELLSSVITKPRFDDREFRKLKVRELERVLGRAKSSGAWAASMLLHRELYRLPTHLHPYASHDALPEEIEKLSLRDCRAFYKQNYTSQNSLLLLAGDIDAETAKRSATRFFSAFRGDKPQALAFASPVPKERAAIYVADRPGSSQSDIYLGLLGPERRDKAFTDLSVANQVLGGGVAGRLFLDVREKRSLAYSTRSTLGEVARGPSPLTIYAGTQTAKTGLAVKALLEHLDRISTEAPGDDEVDTAKRYLADVLALRMETVGAVANMAIGLDVLGLGDDYYDQYRQALGELSREEAFAAASAYLDSDRAAIVVAGDAEKIAPMLSRFGEVRVVDPQKGFARIKTIAQNPSAPLEIEREAGR